jgi:hypothetical protein
LPEAPRQAHADGEAIQLFFLNGHGALRTNFAPVFPEYQNAPHTLPMAPVWRMISSSSEEISPDK